MLTHLKGGRLETSDKRYIQVGKDQWWDTQGVDIVPDEVVDEYLGVHPRVGMCVMSDLPAVNH